MLVVLAHSSSDIKEPFLSFVDIWLYHVFRDLITPVGTDIVVLFLANIGKLLVNKTLCFRTAHSPDIQRRYRIELVSRKRSQKLISKERWIIDDLYSLCILAAYPYKPGQILYRGRRYDVVYGYPHGADVVKIKACNLFYGPGGV